MEPSLIPLPVDSSITGISPVVYMKDLGSHIRIVVNHHHLFEYKKEDKISKVASIVTLLKTGAAKQTEIAQAFDINRDTARRYLSNVERYGLAGLFMTKAGPQGPHKITPKVHRFIVERLRLAQGVGAILKAVKEEFDLELSRRSIELIRHSLREASPPALPTHPLELPFEEKEESVEEQVEESVGVREALSSDDTLEAGPAKETLAGLFFLWPFLHLLRFKEMVSAAFSPLLCLGDAADRSAFSLSALSKRRGLQDLRETPLRSVLGGVTGDGLTHPASQAESTCLAEEGLEFFSSSGAALPRDRSCAMRCLIL